MSLCLHNINLIENKIIMKNKSISILIISILSIFSFSSVAIAQDATPSSDAPSTEQTDASKKEVKGKTVMDMWNAGGLTMYPLAFLAACAISLIVYNFKSLKKDKYLLPKKIDEIENMLNNLQIHEAIETCEKTPAPITNIVGAGLARVNEKEVDMDSIEKAMEEASIEELSGPYVMINYLSVIAAIAPMLGLFGTVSGMVKAFNTIAAEGAGSAQKLADNISEALITTAAGMIIGIPAMFFYFFFKNKFSRITSSISRIVGELAYVLKVSSKYGPQQFEDSSTIAKEIGDPVPQESK